MFDKLSTKLLLLLCVIGIWVIVLQNAGIIPAKHNVFVKGGYLDANVSQPIKVTGTVDVSNSLEIGNTIDVNIHEINGQRDVFFNNPSRGQNDKYYRLPVAVN